MSTFESDLRSFANRTKQSLDKTCRGVAIKWFSSTVMTTPVDTGRLRGNWIVSTGRPTVAVLDRTDPSGAQAQNAIVMGVRGVGHVNYMTNNLDYALEIEYGGSPRKAPQGMVRINFARIRAIIADEARGNQV